jgi:hypothetical protein
MSLSRWDEGSDSDQVTGLTRDNRLVGHRKILALQSAKLPRSGREGAVEVRPFTAKTKQRASEAQGLSGEAVKGNPTTTVIPGVDESKTTPEELSEPETRIGLDLIPVLSICLSYHSNECRRVFSLTNFCETFTERPCKIWVLDAQHHFMSIAMIMEVSIAKDCTNNVGEFGRGLERKLVQTAPWLVNPANPLAYGCLG